MKTYSDPSGYSLVAGFVAAFLLLLGLWAAPAWSAPANSELVIMVQPDGTRFLARPFGDEWANGMETPDGYTIMLNSAGAWVFADQASSGTLVPSPYVVGRDLPSALPPRLRPQAALGSPGAAQSQPLVAPVLGERPVLVLLVQFLNQTGQTTAESWATRIFGNTNSVRDHYDASSLGLVRLTPSNESHGAANDGVVGWLTLNYNHPNTGANTSDANQRIVRDALIAAEPYVNFAAFDTNGDGVVSASELLIVTVVAGNETAFGGTSSCSPGVWGHKWQIFAPPIVDGKSVGGSGYAQFGEMHCAASAPPGHPATIGVMAHEVGHLLGLPDLYDTDGSSEGIGNWSLMAGGTWNGVALVGDLPALLDPWSKYVLGWVTPIQVTDTLTNAMIPASAATATIYQLGTGSALTGTGEYFLVENRQQIDYDAALPAAGLLIWHIEESRFTNTSECIPGGLPACSASVHYKVALVQADNAYDLERRQNRGDGGDPFPGATGNRSLTGVSAPNSNLYGGTPSNASVTSISDSGDIMTATLSVLVGQPTVSASPASILPGGTLTVTWSGITSPSATDWLGLFQPGAPNTAYIDWIYVSCSKTPSGSRAAGSCSFVVPATVAPGTYQLRLLANDGFTPLATSNNVAVTSSGPTVSASPANILPGGTLTVTWSGITSPSATDWLGLFQPGAPNTAYIDWIYVSCSKTPSGSQAAGSCSFVVPATVAPGTYQLRLLANDGFTLLATSNNVAVTSSGPTVSASPASILSGGTLTVTWSGITSPSATDWLGLFQPGAPNTAYIDWIYVSCSKTPNGSGAAGSCSFVVPATAAPGTYQLRLLANDGYTLLATSNNVAVTSSGPTVSANPASILPRGTRP